MGIALGKSTVYLPDTGAPYPALADFLARRFPKISIETWIARIAAGKVLTEEGLPVTLESIYQPDKRLFYYREVAEEPAIPFQEQIIFQNDHLLVACKPPFLPVTPTGPYVRETLLNRLKERTGYSSLSTLHRIDRETSGLVLLSVNKKSRGTYQRMFMTGTSQEDLCSRHRISQEQKDKANGWWKIGWNQASHGFACA